MMDEKDRLGSKLSDVERAREEQWAHERDRELIEKLRTRTKEDVLCPQCHKPLAADVRAGVTLMVCKENHGAWLSADVLEAVIRRLT